MTQERKQPKGLIEVMNTDARQAEVPKAGVVALIGGWIGGLRKKLRAWTEKKTGTPVSPQTIQVLRHDAHLLPEGPLKTLYEALLSQIEQLDESKRRQIVEQHVPQGSTILSPSQQNYDVHLLLEGGCAVYLADGAKTGDSKAVLPRPAPDMFGEMSALLTEGTPTAAVRTMVDSLIMRIPAQLFRVMNEADPSIMKAAIEIMEKRLQHTRTLAGLRETGLDPAQCLAQIALLELQASDHDRAAILDAAGSLAASAKDVFELKIIRAGSQFIRQGQPLGSLMLVLDGRANVFRHGARVRVAVAGDLIGVEDVHTPSRQSQWEYSAITNMTILSVDPKAFLDLQSDMEAIIAKRRQELLREQRTTVNIESAQVPELHDEDMQKLHDEVVKMCHYVPRRQSGNDLIFECGSADQVLTWLGVRGMLSYRGVVGWKIKKVLSSEEFLLERGTVDTPVGASCRELIKENLLPVVHVLKPQETKDALKRYQDAGLTLDQARFLLQRGIVPHRSLNKDHLTSFCRSFEHIQAAMSYIEDWTEKPSAPENRALLAGMLERLLIDTTHQIGITTLMKDPETRDIVLQSLDEMLLLPAISEEEFRACITKEAGPLRQQHRLDAIRWNGTGATRRMTLLKAHLLADPNWGVLYHMSSRALHPTQSRQLSAYVQKLDAEICPALVAELEELLRPTGASGEALPLITARTKNAEGILDKLMRKQSGNNGNAYCLADMPDAVGARVIVEDVRQLEEAMTTIEGKCGASGRLFEKDDFYGNPEKQMKSPYRLVTYIIECKGVPVEIQLQTRLSAVAASIEHDIIYKPYAPASLDERALASLLQRAVALVETRQRLQRSSALTSATPRPQSTGERAAKRHVFQSASLSGRCICSYVSEGNPSWGRDLAEARSYFRWREGRGAVVTMHQGSSAIDCSSCIGVPTWSEFRTHVIGDLKRQSNVPDVIAALEREGTPLFVIEEFAKDLDVEANESAFLRQIEAKYTPQECAGITQALKIAKRAHHGQSYAIEKRDAAGKPVYTLSLALKHVPYVNHCVQVARLAVICDLSADAVQAALLHDVLEDTQVQSKHLAQAITPKALMLVQAVTKQPGQTRETYMEQVKTLTGEAKILKALDRCHNLLRAFNLRDSNKYLTRIVTESQDIFAGDFAPNAALSKLAVQFQMFLEAVEQLRQRKFGTAV